MFRYSWKERSVEGTSVLREQLRWSHDTIEQAVADLPPEDLHRRIPGATIDSIAAVYAHAVVSEDWLISRFVRRRPPLFERDGWAERVGLRPWSEHGPSEDWSAAVPTCDFAALREYARRVYAASDDVLGSLSAADLDRPVVFGPLGEMPLGAFLASIVAAHTSHHGGEICALKGVLGYQGLPY